MTAPKAATPRPDVEAVGMDTGMNPDPTLQPDQAEASAKQGESVMVGLEWTNGIWGKVLPPGTIKPGQAYQVRMPAGLHCICQIHPADAGAGRDCHIMAIAAASLVAQQPMGIQMDTAMDGCCSTTAGMG